MATNMDDYNTEGEAMFAEENDCSLHHSGLFDGRCPECEAEDKIICPNCKKQYIPILERKTDKCIQNEYPNAPKWQREQLISGLCSDKCWNEYLGIPC